MDGSAEAYELYAYESGEGRERRKAPLSGFAEDGPRASPQRCSRAVTSVYA